MLTLDDGRSELWQWDTGRKLTVDAECSQVHFSNKVFGRSIDVDVIDGVATIPDILLQTDKELTAWAFVGTVENGYTKISKVFVVNRRNKPADYVFTPTDQTSIKELNNRIEKLEANQDPEAVGNAVKEYLENNPIKEKDPTVPQWAKQPEKPAYTAEEVGALPNTTKIPSKTSELENDSEFAKQTDVDKLYEEIDDLKENGVGGGSGSGLSATAKNLLINILKNAVYETDQSSNITALEVALVNSSSGGESGDTTSGISQIGSILIIESDVIATQTDTVLTIA